MTPEEALAGVIRRHRENRSNDRVAVTACSCGWAPALSTSSIAVRNLQPTALEQYATHVAEELAAAIRGHDLAVIRADNLAAFAKELQP